MVGFFHHVLSKRFRGTMEINAQLVKQLREQTGAGMMECKTALVESKGDLAGAEIVLRKKGYRLGRQAVFRAPPGRVSSAAIFTRAPSWACSLR